MAKPRQLTILKQKVINRLVKAEYINWPRDLKILKGLLEKYPDLEFWGCMTLGFQLNNLGWLLTPEGKIKLDDYYRVFKVQPEKHIEFKIEDKKFGEDYVFDKKPTTLLELFK